MSEELRQPKCQVPLCQNTATKCRRVSGKNGSTKLKRLCDSHYHKRGERLLEKKPLGA